MTTQATNMTEYKIEQLEQLNGKLLEKLKLLFGKINWTYILHKEVAEIKLLIDEAESNKEIKPGIK